MNKNPLVSVPILNWNRKDETIRAIHSIKNQSYTNIEIVVIDNGSTDNSYDTIKNTFPEAIVVQLDKNYGCPGGRNLGVKYCKGEYIFFCDNDGVLHRDAIKNAIQCILSCENAVIVTGLVKDFNSESEIDTCLHLNQAEYKLSHDFQGGISLHKRFVFDQIDQYPIDYMYGGEETYLSLRVLDAGFSIIKCEQVILWHKRSKIRNVKLDLLKSYSNKLKTAYQLYPFEYFLLFFIYYLFVYPIYSIRNKVFLQFILSMLENTGGLIKYKRRPIRRDTYKKYLKLRAGSSHSN